MKARIARSIRKGVLDARKYQYRYGGDFEYDFPVFRDLVYERAFLQTRSHLQDSKQKLSR